MDKPKSKPRPAVRELTATELQQVIGGGTGATGPVDIANADASLRRQST